VSGAGASARRRRTTVISYAFLSPALILFILFLLAPIVYTGYLSLRRERVSGLGLGAGARREVFAGMENYRLAVTDAELWRGALRVLAYGGILVPTMLVLALLFALMLDARRVGARRFSRLAIFLPYAVPGVIATLLWGFLYLPRVSPFQDVLQETGVGTVDLMSPTSIYFSLANIALWGGVGFNMIVMYTALRAIPAELYESARIDGAGEAQIALRIKVPMITPALVLTAVFSTIATLQVFSEPTTLAPLTNSLSTTWTPLMKIYRDAFVRNDIYSAAATSIVLALVTLVLSFGLLRLLQDRAFGNER
jgi:multiple sugar transport system permease protein